MSQVETFSLPNVMSSEISALVRAGFYSSKSDVAKDAIRCLFQNKPHLKISAAVELYKEGEVSIGKAAEIAEMSTIDFKEVLRERNIVQIVRSTPKRVKKGLKAIRKSRR